jgi:Domain of unknown function (DUF4129)
VIVRAARWRAAVGSPPGSGPGIGRRAAQQLAHRELSRSLYQESIVARFWHWVGQKLSDLLNAGDSLPGGWWTTVVLVTALVLVAAMVIFWIRPAGQRQWSAGALLAGPALSARDHRELAERQAAAGDYQAAIIERVRAVAVSIDERGVLSAQPGRTADELALQAGRALPALAGPLAAAAHLFDDLLYGGREGTAAGYDSICLLDSMILDATAKYTAASDAPA